MLPNENEVQNDTQDEAQAEETTTQSTNDAPADASSGEKALAKTQLWEALGRWSAYLSSNGSEANLAPPQYLIDAMNNYILPPSTVSLEEHNKRISELEARISELEAKGK